jgi:hypothetical protein
MREIIKWDYDEKKIEVLRDHIELFEKICCCLEGNSWFWKRLQAECNKSISYDLLTMLKRIDDKYSANFSIKLFSKCVILSLCSQELSDSSGLRYVLVNKCSMMFVNTIIKYGEELKIYEMDFRVVLRKIVMKSIMFLEICDVFKTKTFRIGKKKIVCIESLKSGLEFNDDFRFQSTKYSAFQNLVCEYEDLALNDLVIRCEMYEYNQPFAIRNIRNMTNIKGNLSDIFELINNKSVIDVKYYEHSLNESIKSKMIIIKKLSNSVDHQQKIENIERLISKKKRFLEKIRINNEVYFMKKICFRARFYDISELGVTNSKEIRYAIKYDYLSREEIDIKICEIKKTIYYNRLLEYVNILSLKEFYLDKFKDFDGDGVLVICICILITIGMEFKNIMIKEGMLMNIEGFIKMGEKWLKLYINIGELCLNDIDDWEKRVYLKKMFDYINDGNIWEGMVINKDYSSSVFFNMVRMFSSDDEFCRAFNVGDCSVWSCGYTFLIGVIKDKIGLLSKFEEEFLTKKNLKRALMTQPYNVGRFSAKDYMKENLELDQYNDNKVEYDLLIDKIVSILSNIKKNKLFKREFDDLVSKIIDNKYILKLSDIEVSMSYCKVVKDKRVIVKYKNIKKQC